MRTELERLETPVPVVDLDRLERNLARAADYARGHGVTLRPHVKTHKSPVVAAGQMERGAVGLTCATPRELEVMSTAASDLLCAYPPIGASTLVRLMALPLPVALSVSLDSHEAIAALAVAARQAKRTVRVLVEVDVGMHRVGVPTARDAIALARAVREGDGLVYGGVAFYPGHIRMHVNEQEAALELLNDRLSSILREMDDAGVRPPIVSGGSTPTLWRTHEMRRVTECRAGTYVFNDRTTMEIGACAWEDCALTVLASVVSTSVSGQAVIDAGSKALGREPIRGTTGDGFGVVLTHPEVTVASMSEEHGILDLGATTWRPRVGEQVRIVPNHVCIVVHLHEQVYGLRGDKIVAEWPVAARGRRLVASELRAGAS
jgi:D-serine deaminase-like pyridoxal phosphate-dependent protein